MTQRISLNVRSHRLLRELLGCISRGLFDYNRIATVDLKGVQAVLAEACINNDVELAFKNAVPGVPPDAERIVVRAYLETVKRERDSEVSRGRAVPYAFQLDHEAFQELHREILGYDFFVEAQPSGIGNGAFIAVGAAKAWWHVTYYNSLNVAAQFLQEVFGQLRIEAGKQSLADARVELGVRAGRSLGDYAKFALLQDDPEQQALARQRVYAMSFSEGMVISQYLSEDRYYIGRTSVTEENAFRAELLDAVKRSEAIA